MSVIVIFRKLASKYGNVSVIENLNVLVNSHPTFQESKRTQTCYFSNETTTLTDFTTHTVTFQTQQLEVFILSQTNSSKHLSFLQIMTALYTFQTQQLCGTLEVLLHIMKNVCSLFGCSVVVCGGQRVCLPSILTSFIISALILVCLCCCIG
jgi:hypothetical protein